MNCHVDSIAHMIVHVDRAVDAMGSDHASRTDGGARSPEGQLDYDLTSTLLVTVYLLKSSTIQEISVCRPQQATL